jgi:uncharacterized membrane protein YdbT with pleckstrin-like domain
MAKLPNNTIWSDRKRTLFGLPWSFTKYILTDDKLLIRSGVLSQREEEIRLYRVRDLELKRSFRDRLDRVGTIHVCSSDNTAPEIDIRRIKHSRYVKDMISDQVEKMRTAHNAVEMYTNTPHFHDDPGDLSDAL